MALGLPPLNFKPHCSSTSTFSSSSTNYRPAVILPGLGNNTGDHKKLEFTLQEYGVPTVVAKVSRIDWLRNAAGLVDPNYWKGTLQPRPVLDWYLKRVDDAVQEAEELAQGGKLSVIGHSAGGWLARVYMEEFGLSHISLLLTLGTPHLPPPKGLPGVIDQTRGLLYYVQQHCKKAVYTPELKYVCIAGRYLQGARFVNDSKVAVESMATIDDDQQVSDVAVVKNKTDSTPVSTTFQARFVGQGYKQFVGRQMFGVMELCQKYRLT
ncbi:hypothetical protein E1A91_D11G262900v1 [Gossypium mustelinum]|uniref:GPI inositol-deacylase n=1 Tax=Gossypium mustelinum TaxID=34275 RepID=A0A5D2SWH5_GOSMU|nr:hypothetical protein E1A91_D11G262900v1 [Gossypium mustelinum]